LEAKPGPGRDKPYSPKGSAGFGARLLVDFVERMAAKK
jgi:hypothetical protein